LKEQKRLPLGLIFQDERSALETLALNHNFPEPALQDITDPRLFTGYREAMLSFMK